MATVKSIISWVAAHPMAAVVIALVLLGLALLV